MLPVSLALGAVVADAAGLHSLALYALLLSIPGAAAAAFVAAGDALDDRREWLRAGSSGAALALLVLGSAVRENAPHGAAIPTLAVSAVVAAVVVYAAPLVAWLLQPLVPRPLRYEHAPAVPRRMPITGREASSA